MRRAPLFTSFVVLLLAFGTGASTLIFTTVNALLLRPLPVVHPQALLRLGVQRSPALISFEHPYLYARLLNRQSQSFDGVFATWTLDMDLTSGTQPENIAGETVSGNYFEVLGLRAARGRLLTDDDEVNGAPNIVLSYGFWHRYLGGASDVIGRTVRLRGSPFTVVGIAPKSFTGLDLESRTDVWLPMSAGRAWAATSDVSRTPARVYLRLRPGISTAQAEAEVRTSYPAMVVEYASGVRAYTTEDVRREQALRPSLESVANGASTLRKTFGRAAVALLGAVLVLLLLVCANVGGLMFARTQAKAQDVAVRISLGATAGHLFRGGIFEGLGFTVPGAIVGWALAHAAAPLLLHLLPQRRPLSVDLAPDWRVVAFAAGVSIVATILVSIVPAWYAMRTGTAFLLNRSSGRISQPRAGRMLVTVQVALATLLAVTGISLVRSLERLRDQDPGFRREDVIVADVNPRLAGLRAEDVPSAYREAIRRIRGLPGVNDVSISERALMRGVGYKGTAGPAGTQPSFLDAMNISLNAVSGNYFESLGMRVLNGRGFEPGDSRRKPKATLVSRSFATKFFPGADPIGRLFGLGQPGTVLPPQCQIVGVVNDAKYRGMRETPPPTAYSLIELDNLSYPNGLTLHVVTSRDDTDRMSEEIRQALAGVGQGLATSFLATLEQETETSLWQERLLAALSSGFALVAVVLASAGLFGILALSVSKRKREIGVRVALGATAARIVSMICLDAAWSVVPGIGFGLAIYAAFSRALTDLLFGITVWNPVSWVMTLVVIVLLSVLATVLPAVRAISIQPADALRME